MSDTLKTGKDSPAELAGTTRAVCMIGPFPPPRHGVSAVNESMRLKLEALGREPTVINTAPPSLDRRLRVRLRRIGRIGSALLGILRQVRCRPDTVCYFSLSGGFGLLFESLMVLTARLGGAGIVLHHHSFRYLDVPYQPMRLLVKAAGPAALHVTLGHIMAVRLQLVYPTVKNTLVLSNAGFVGRGNIHAPPDKPRPVKVGFLSNLSVAKGLDDFLALAEASGIRGLPWRFIMAGPFENETDSGRWMPRIQALSNLEYRGPLYAAGKTAFMGEIDVFVFPTRYRNEAEPLVVLEALSHGCPVISYARGCIAELLGCDGGLAIPVGEDFVRHTLGILEAWRSEGTAFNNRSASARRRFSELQAQSAIAFQELLERFGITDHEGSA